MRDEFDPLAEMRDMLKVDKPSAKSIEQLRAELVKNNQEIQTLKLKGLLHLVEKEVETVMKSITCSFQSHMISNPKDTLKIYQLSFFEMDKLPELMENSPEALFVHCPYDIHGVYEPKMESCNSEEEMRETIKRKIVANIAHDIAYIEEQNAEISAELKRKKAA